MAKQGTATVAPTLRFPEFRDSEGWNERPLARACERITQGGTPDTSNPGYWDGDIAWLTPAEMGKSDNPHISSTARRITEQGLRNCSSELLPTKSVIISTRAPIGHLAINAVPMAINQGCKGLVSGAGLDHRFLLAFLSTAKSRLVDLGAGNTFKELSAGALKSFAIPVPSYGEQQKIADCLMSLDEVIAAQGRKVEALKAHKRGLMQQLFPREGETRPRLRFPEFRDAPEWVVGKASDIVDVLQGYGFPERLQGSQEGDFPFYKVSDISACVDAGGILLDEANNHIDAGVLEELRAKLMPVGSTVFAKIGEAIRSNKRAITSRPCLVDNNAAGVKAVAGLAHDRFVYYLWCQVPLIEYAGGVVPAVNKSAMEQIPVCYPKPDEQQRIADCLSSLDTQITAESNQLAALKTHKQGLMQQLFPAPEGGS